MVFSDMFHRNGCLMVATLQEINEFTKFTSKMVYSTRSSRLNVGAEIACQPLEVVKLFVNFYKDAI